MDGWRGLCCTSAANTNWTPSQSATALSRDAASVWRHGLMEDPPQWQRMVHFDCGWFAMALATDMHLHVPPWSCVQSGTMALSMAISPALLEGTDSTCFSPCGASATKSTPRATEFCGLSARFEGRAGHSRPDAGAQRLWCTCFNSGLWLSLLQEGFSESRWWRGAYVSLPWYDFHASVAIWYYGMSSLFAWIPHFWEIESASASQFQLQIASTKSTQFAIARCWGRICREHRPWTQAWWTCSSATRTWPTIAWSSFEGGWALWHWTVCEGHRTLFAKWPSDPRARALWPPHDPAHFMDGVLRHIARHTDKCDWQRCESFWVWSAAAICLFSWWFLWPQDMGLSTDSHPAESPTGHWRVGTGAGLRGDHGEYSASSSIRCPSSSITCVFRQETPRGLSRVSRRDGRWLLRHRGSRCVSGRHSGPQLGWRHTTRMSALLVWRSQEKICHRLFSRPPLWDLEQGSCSCRAISARGQAWAQNSAHNDGNLENEQFGCAWDPTGACGQPIAPFFLSDDAFALCCWRLRSAWASCTTQWGALSFHLAHALCDSSLSASRRSEVWNFPGFAWCEVTKTHVNFDTQHARFCWACLAG